MSGLGPVKIKTLYSENDKMIILEFEDYRGPIFRSWFRPQDLRELCYSVLDTIQQIEIDKGAPQIDPIV